MPPITESSDRRIIRTRRMLKDALVSLMEEKDFDEITVQDIAERATINRATFYAHFEDIYALLAYIIKDSFVEVLGRHVTAGRLQDADSSRLLIVAVCDFLDELSRKCESKPACRPCEAFVEANIKEVLREMILPWIRLSGEDEPELRATLTSWSIYAAAWEWQARQRSMDKEQFAEMVMPLIVSRR